MTTTENRNDGRRGFLLDFRDEHGNSTVNCAVCGSPADAWDTRSNVVFHSSASAFVARKPACHLQVGL